MSLNDSSSVSSLVDPCMNIDIVFKAIRVILLLPVSIIILYLGLQKWRQQHSFRKASHSDILTYHLAAMELFFVLGWFCLLCAGYVKNVALVWMGLYISLIVFYGEILFHILTCVERYLAVVHPVIYMGLKNTRGVRIRNITIVCVWLLCFVLIIIQNFIVDENAIELFCLLAVSIILTCYCSIYILCVLIRPGPGDGAREKERVDKSKQRAFNTIIATSAALWLWFVGRLFAVAVTVTEGSPSVNYNVPCLVTVTVSLLNFPSCLVSPLLYLHKARKLTFSCCSRD